MSSLFQQPSEWKVALLPTGGLSLLLRGAVIGGGGPMWHRVQSADTAHLRHSPWGDCSAEAAPKD
eukprot:2851784-Amphidinium_carterae.1